MVSRYVAPREGRMELDTQGPQHGIHGHGQHHSLELRMEGRTAIQFTLIQSQDVTHTVTNSCKFTAKFHCEVL